MSEIVPYRGSSPEAFPDTLAVPVPKIPEELYGYFVAREVLDPPGYAGYADLAAAATDAIAEASRYGRTDDEKANDFAILPGYVEGVYMSDLTNQSKELLTLIISTHDLDPVVDEVSDDSPYGRILWQNSDNGAGLNVIEHRWNDARGTLVKFTAVSHLPEDMMPVAVRELMADLDDLPIVQIDETELVKNYFKHAA
jgi:hypothetical protein